MNGLVCASSLTECLLAVRIWPGIWKITLFLGGFMGIYFFFWRSPSRPGEFSYSSYALPGPQQHTLCATEGTVSLLSEM